MYVSPQATVDVQRVRVVVDDCPGVNSVPGAEKSVPGQSAFTA